MFPSSSQFRSAGLSVLLGAAIATGAAGCGDDKKSSAAITPGPALTGRPDVSEVSCSALANRENYNTVYDSAIALVSREKVADGSNVQVATRSTGAMADMCRKRGEGDYRPGDDAVAAVRSGKYPAEVSIK